MTKDWYQSLKALRAADEKAKSKHVPPEPKTKKGEVDQLLKTVNALGLLRDMRRHLLGGVGRIELFEQANGYDLVLMLMWDGPISAARFPSADSQQHHHIFIGVRNNELHVNGKPVAISTSAALKMALIEAAKKPGTRTDLTK